MREIEFRVWWKEEKKMYGVSELQLSSESVTCCNLGTKDRPYFYVDNRDIELMQYTGLKDKNSVKIFEGDIVKCDDDLCYVVFDEYWFAYRFKNKEVDDTFAGFIPKNLEVIGNIYENPELLPLEEL